MIASGLKRLRWFIGVQLSCIVVAVVLAIIEIESIVYTGVILSFGGVVIAVLSRSWGIGAGVLFGWYVPSLSIVCFLLIFVKSWGPTSAAATISLILLAQLPYATVLGIVAIRRCTQSQVAVGRVKFQFSLATLMITTALVAILCALVRAGGSDAAFVIAIILYVGATVALVRESRSPVVELSAELQQRDERPTE